MAVNRQLPGSLMRTALLICCLLIPAALSVRPQATGRLNSSDKAGYGLIEKIHFGDIVDVDVVGSLEFDWRGGLSPEGFLDGMDRIEEPVYALCRTESEVAGSIREQYSKFLRDPEVIVRIVDRSNRALAYINGAVKTPQRFQLRRPATLAELIVLSGGITDSSNGEIVVFRPPNVNCSRDSENGADGKAAPERFSIKIADLLRGDVKANTIILSGDIVDVNQTAPIFVTGSVTAPKRMNLTPGLTLSRAVSAAGGLAKPFRGQKARIYRRGASVIEVDIYEIVEKKGEDKPLQPYDVVEVEQKGGGDPRPVSAIEPLAPGPETLSKLPLRIVD
jgi:protein involved in polysaccharide export with SLBB domain